MTGPTHCHALDNTDEIVGFQMTQNVTERINIAFDEGEAVQKTSRSKWVVY